MKTKLVSLTNKLWLTMDRTKKIGISGYVYPDFTGVRFSKTPGNGDNTDYPFRGGRVMKFKTFTDLSGRLNVIEVNIMGCSVNRLNAAGVWEINEPLTEVLSQFRDVRDVMVVQGKEPIVIIGTADGTVAIYSMKNYLEIGEIQLKGNSKFSTIVDNLQVFFQGRVPHILVSTVALDGHNIKGKVFEFVLGEGLIEVTNQKASLSFIINRLDHLEGGMSPMAWIFDEKKTLHLVIGGNSDVYDVIRGDFGWSLNMINPKMGPRIDFMFPAKIKHRGNTTMLYGFSKYLKGLDVGKDGIKETPVPYDLRPIVSSDRFRCATHSAFTYTQPDGKIVIVTAGTKGILGEVNYFIPDDTDGY